MSIYSCGHNKRFISLVIIFISGSIFISLASLNISTVAQDTSTPEAGLSTISGADYITITSGQNVEYKLNLKNQGSQSENFLLSLESSYNWDVTLSKTAVNLGKDESEIISVNFNEIPYNLAEKDYLFKVIVKSRNILAEEKTIHVIADQNEVIITAALKPVIILKPSLDNLGKLVPGKHVEFDVDVKCYVVSADVYLDYEVLKKDTDKIPANFNLDVKIEPAKYDFEKGENHTFKVIVSFPKNYNKKVNDNFRLRLEARAYDYDEVITNPKTIAFIAKHDPTETRFIDTIISSPIAMVGITTAVTLGIVGSAIGSTEVGKYKLFLLFFIPLYTKLHKDKILDHFTRGRVYEFIRNNPGVHYSELKRELDLNNGSLTYHLHTLEREALIKAQNIGRYKLFYPTGVKIPKDMEPQISAVRQQILELIKTEPGITQKELGLKMGDKSQRTISYHVKNMEREGILRLERDGRERRCYINDDVIDAGEGKKLEAKAEYDEHDDKYMDKDSIFRQI